MSRCTSHSDLPFIRVLSGLGIVLLIFSLTAGAGSVTLNCGGVDDSAAINAAVGTAGASVSLNGTCVGANIRPASNVTLLCNGPCTLEKLASDTTNYLIKTQGTTNITVQGLTLDLNGSPMTTSPNALVYSQADTGLQYTDCTFQNSGASNLSTGGIALFKSGAQITENTFADTILGYQVQVDMGGINNPVLIQNNQMSGGQWDSIFFANQGGSIGSATQSVISGNTITQPQDGQFGTGQYGNCIDVFQISGVVVHDNTCQSADYSGIRLNNSNQVHVYNNTINGCRETSLYAEFGAENNEFDHNTITNGNTGISLTNLADRPTQDFNSAHDNTITNMAQFGIGFEHDNVYNNVIQNTPYGIELGFGSTGSSMTVQNNTVTGLPSSTVGPMIHAITIDKNLTSQTNVISCNPISNILYAPIAAADFSTLYDVGYIANAPNATVWMTQWPPIGSTVLFSGVRGMTQINGQSAEVTGWGTSVSSITVTDGGSGYTSAPMIVFGSGCSGSPTATATIANGHLVNVTLTSPGSGCTAVPSGTVSGGGGSAARVHVFAPMMMNLDTSAFSTWQPIPQGRPLPELEVLYKSGTTLNATIPDAVQILNQTMKFDELGTPENGSVITVPDAQISNPCEGGGTGALATRTGGQWVCTAIPVTPPPLTVTASFLNPRIYPNPWRSDKGYAPQITIDQLTTDCEVKIFTISGHLVRDLTNVNMSTTWDLKNDSGSTVASGIYFYEVTNSQGNKAIGKFAVIH